MTCILSELWRDDDGVILSSELVIVGTLLVVGLISGTACLQQAVDGELRDLGRALGSLDQSYAIAGHRKSGFHGRLSAWTAGSDYINCDDRDPRDEDLAGCCVLPVKVHQSEGGCPSCGKPGCSECGTLSPCGRCGRTGCRGCATSSPCHACGGAGCRRCDAPSGCQGCGRIGCGGYRTGLSCDWCGGSGCDGCRTTVGCSLCGRPDCGGCTHRVPQANRGAHWPGDRCGDAGVPGVRISEWSWGSESRFPVVDPAFAGPCGFGTGIQCPLAPLPVVPPCVDAGDIIIPDDVW